MSERRDMSGLCVGLVGSVPGRPGGISIHLQRLATRLRDRGARVVVAANNGGTEVGEGIALHQISSGRRQVLDVTGLVRKERIDLLHFHTFGGHWKTIAPWLLIKNLTGVPVIISQHSMRTDPKGMSRFERAMSRFCSEGLSHTVCSGVTVFEKFRQLGVADDLLSQNTPFIAPQRPNLLEHTLPAEIAALVKRTSPLITSGTGALVEVDGKDLYGLDVFVRAAKRVLERCPGAGFVYLIGAAGGGRLLQDAREYVQESGLEEQVCIHVGDLPGTVMWATGDIFVRPTLDDGDAVSLCEALFLGIPSVASDAVPRPQGCRTFRSGDIEDCARVLVEVAEELEGHRRLVEREPPVEAIDGLMEVYGRALGERSWLNRLRPAWLRGDKTRDR